MFFGFDGANMNQRMYRYQRQNQRQRQNNEQHPQQQQQPAAMLLQSLPLIMFLIFSLVSSLGGGIFDSTASYNYSYTQTHLFPVRLESYRLKQPYFVSNYVHQELSKEDDFKFRVSLTKLLKPLRWMNALRVMYFVDMTFLVMMPEG